MSFPDIPSVWPAPLRAEIDEALKSRRITAIRSVLRKVGELPEAMRGRPFNLGIVRTFTIETQLEALELALAVLPCRPHLSVGPLESLEQTLLDPQSDLLRAQPDAILALWRIDELHPRLAYEAPGMSATHREDAADALIKRIVDLCRKFTAISPTPLFISTLPMPPDLAGHPADSHDSNGLRSIVFRINHALLAIASGGNQIHIFDFAAWAERFGEAAFDRKMDFFARQPLSSAALMSFSTALARTFRPLLYPSSKVLALDLDNVLWGGVIGEEGLQGLKIGHDFPGNVYRRIQQYALNLRARGTLLVLLSKNNQEDVEEAFGSLPDMPLRLEHFAATRINWREKHANLAEMATELSLGLDSFVFVDDQQFEREQMMFNLPQVKTLSVTEDPLVILNALTGCGYFDAYRTSTEDLMRSNDYVMQHQRKELERRSGSGEEFLATLNLQATISPVNDASLGRAVQMLAKTNQFNVSTRRHGEADIRRIMAGPCNVLLVLSLRDRFSDQGIVGLGIAVTGATTDEVFIDSLLLSCRAIGRGAEAVLWAAIISRVNALGYRRLSADYLASSKNQQVADLFDKFGMQRIGEDSGRRRYVLELPANAPAPDWIDIQDMQDNE